MTETNDQFAERMRVKRGGAPRRRAPRGDFRVNATRVNTALSNVGDWWMALCDYDGIPRKDIDTATIESHQIIALRDIVSLGGDDHHMVTLDLDHGVPVGWGPHMQQTPGMAKAET